MKLKTTRKQIRDAGMPIVAVGYCDLQTTFHVLGIEPFAYSTRAEGWACDYYEIDGRFIISTGYAPIGQQVKDYKRMRAIEEKAREFSHSGCWWKRGPKAGIYRRLHNWLYQETKDFYERRFKKARTK